MLSTPNPVPVQNQAVRMWWWGGGHVFVTIRVERVDCSGREALTPVHSDVTQRQGKAWDKEA